MAYQAAARLNNLPCIKAEQGKLARGVGSQKPRKELATAPAPTVKCPTEDQATQIYHMQRI